MNNKLVGIWNVFDGEELLPFSVNSVRKEVDFRICILQTISNYGERYIPQFKKSLFDYIYIYEPDLKRSRAWNETKKRNIGLEIALEYNCSHFISFDCDEMYIENEFSAYKELIYKENIETSACKMWTYYKKPTLILDPPEEYFVPFICKLNEQTKLGMNRLFPVVCDPTRTPMSKGKFLKIEERLLHHFSFVRRDIRRKLANSSSLLLGEDLQTKVTQFNQGQIVHFKDVVLKEVPNIFNI